MEDTGEDDREEMVEPELSEFVGECGTGGDWALDEGRDFASSSALASSDAFL